ncbi:MAG: hypothetical protein KBA53_09380 [Thermoclostridium sp.]|nr:hypothetical protein [Thermoclostridium sp.]
MIASRYIQQRYNLDKQGLKKLFGVMNKWDSMKNKDKIKVINEWPEALPFFTKKVVLNAGRRRDEWRYFYYSNQISELPESIGKLKNITELHLDYQELPMLPECIGELESLEVLNLEDNKLKSIPESITRLKNLRVLKLKQNYGLESLPDFSMLPNLEVLDLSFTNVKTLPEGFFLLKSIKKIVTENCELDHKTAIIRRLRTAFPDAEIVTFCDAAIKIEDGTAGNEYMGKETIKITEASLNYLPAQLFDADIVKELIIECWKLEELPDLFGKLQTLEKLKISIGQKINELPASIGSLINLKELRLEGAFNAFPAEIGNLSNLEVLELKGASITELPDFFPQLKELRALKIKYTPITSFAQKIAPLQNLKKIELEYSGINHRFELEVPLTALTNLESFSIETKGTITEDILKLPASLKSLNINCYRADKTYSPLSLGRLLNHFSNLRELSIQAVDLSDISEAIVPNDSLEVLFLQHLLFPEIPDCIENLKKMTSISLLNTQLQKVNPKLYNCSQLQSLHISRASFSTIPQGIEKLQNLVRLGFQSSDIEKLPEGLFELKNLKKMTLDCPLFFDKSFKESLKKKFKGIDISKEWYG